MGRLLALIEEKVLGLSVPGSGVTIVAAMHSFAS
jgi:hypothetical protein